MKYTIALLLCSCSAPTPAQEAVAVKTAIEAGRAGCLVAQAKSVDLTPAQRAWCSCR